MTCIFRNAKNFIVVEVEAIIPEGTPQTTLITTARSSSGVGVASSVSPSQTVTADGTQARSVEVDPIGTIAAAATGDALAVTAAGRQPSPQTSASSSKSPSADGGGFYLQLAAFGSLNNAESYLGRAKVQIAWLAQLLHLFPRDGLYRIHAGPYASSSEARDAAERIGLAVGGKPLIVTR